jgi:hypothetical protein
MAPLLQDCTDSAETHSRQLWVQSSDALRLEFQCWQEAAEQLAREICLKEGSWSNLRCSCGYRPEGKGTRRSDRSVDRTAPAATPESERLGLIAAHERWEHLRRFVKPASELESELEQHNTPAKRQQSFPFRPGSARCQDDLVDFGWLVAAAAADSAVVVAVPGAGAAVEGVDPTELEAEPDVGRLALAVVAHLARSHPEQPSPVGAARVGHNTHSKPLHVPPAVVLPSRHLHILVQPVEIHDWIVSAGAGYPAHSELSLCHAR